MKSLSWKASLILLFGLICFTVGQAHNPQATDCPKGTIAWHSQGKDGKAVKSCLEPEDAADLPQEKKPKMTLVPGSGQITNLTNLAWSGIVHHYDFKVMLNGKVEISREHGKDIAWNQKGDKCNLTELLTALQDAERLFVPGQDVQPVIKVNPYQKHWTVTGVYGWERGGLAAEIDLSKASPEELEQAAAARRDLIKRIETENAAAVKLANEQDAAARRIRTVLKNCGCQTHEEKTK